MECEPVAERLRLGEYERLAVEHWETEYVLLWVAAMVAPMTLRVEEAKTEAVPRKPCAPRLALVLLVAQLL